MKSNYDEKRDSWLLFSSQNKMTAEEKRWAKIRRDEMQEEWYSIFLEDEYGENERHDEYGTYFYMYDEEK